MGLMFFNFSTDCVCVNMFVCDSYMGATVKLEILMVLIFGYYKQLGQKFILDGFYFDNQAVI